jgi:hypothetical protein
MNNTNSVTSRETLPGDLAEFLNEVKVEHALTARGRLIFALDATASRKSTWDMAASLTSQMFREAGTIGALDLQLVFYRGNKECQASGWVSDAHRLIKMMTRIDCAAGETQIAKILTHATRETEKLQVNALVFIGDSMEENPDALVTRARELGKFKTPVFMFQEGSDPIAEIIFRDIAKDAGGAYGRFDAGAAKQLGELLKAAVLFATGGIVALEHQKDKASTLLLEQLRGRA